MICKYSSYNYNTQISFLLPFPFLKKLKIKIKKGGRGKVAQNRPEGSVTKMISHLTILRPSPTTISYTLSTRSPNTWHHTFTFLLRCILFFTAVLVCLFRAEHLVPMIIPPGWVRVEVGASGSVVIEWIRGLSWMIVGPVAGVGFFVVFRRFHVGEFFLFNFFSSSAFACLFVESHISFLVLEGKGVRGGGGWRRVG